MDQLLLKPVYFKNSDIQKCASARISDFEILRAAEKSVGSNVKCVQLDRDLWRIYFKSEASKNKILNEGLQFQNQTIIVFESNPYSTGLENPGDKALKVTIKGVPLSVDNSAVKNMLDQLNVKVKSELKYEKIRDPVTRKMTDVLNGNRFLYIEPLSDGCFLPRNSYCAGLKCRIYHYGQPSQNKPVICTNCWKPGHHKSDCNDDKCCKVCNEPGHEPGDKKCKWFCEKPKNVEAFSGKENVISNFYMCNLKVYETEYKSAEHAYQHIRALRSGDLIAAEKIESAPNALNAKLIGNKVQESQSWKDTCEEVMNEIIEQKASQVREFSDKLLASKDKTVFAEATWNDTWASGLDEHGTVHTKPEAWPGQNLLGQIVTAVARKLKKNLKLSSQKQTTKNIGKKGQQNIGPFLKDMKTRSSSVTASQPAEAGDDSDSHTDNET